MAAINGIGIRFLGFSKPDADGSCYATNWITFLYLPIIPLSRLKLIIDREGRDWVIHKKYYVILSKENLLLKEIFSTYLFGWILFPLLIFGPMILCFKEVGDAIGLPSSEFKGLINGPNFGVREFLFIGSLIWVIVVIWKLKNWDEKRGLVKI